MQRRRSKPHTFEDRISTERARVEQAAATLSNGPHRDALLRKIDQLDEALRINDWLSSPGLEPLHRRPPGLRTFEGRIAADRARAQQQAAKLPKGPRKDALLKKVDQLDKALNRYGWLSSPGLQRPT